MSYSTCVKCEEMVPAYEKYCAACLKRHPDLVQIADYWKHPSQPISPQSKACRNPNHALTDGTPSPHEIGPSCMAEQSKAPEPQKLTQHVCDCGRRLLVEGLVIGTERL
jgi:hypothetical protein